MAVTYTPLDLTLQRYAIGRGIVFYADKWDGTTPLELTNLGVTEGEITVELNEEYSTLTLMEQTGPAQHKAYVSGENPVVTLPLFYADPNLRSIVSPTGNASGGYQRRRPVTERTLVIFPEELLYDPNTDTYQPLSFDGTWTVGGNPLNSEQTALLGLSMWFWRGYFTKAGPVFRHEDGGKALQSITFQAMTSDLPLDVLPDGERLYTLGDPQDKGIDILAES